MTEGRARMVDQPTPAPEEQADRVVRRAKARRQIITLLVIFVFCAATAWIWAWPAKADTGGSSESSVSILAEDCTVSVPIAGWVQVERPCSSQKPLPPIVRKCAGSAAVGALFAWLSGGTSLLFGAGSGLAGCIPWAND